MIWIIPVLVLAVFALLIAYGKPLGNGNAYRPKNWETILQQSVTAGKGNERLLGSSSAEKRGGLNLIWLKGSPYEMGVQHGRLLKDEISKGVLFYHADPIHNLAPFSQMKPFMQWILDRYFTWTIYFPLLRGAPRSFLEELKGLSDSSAIPFEEVFRGNMLSEFNMATTKQLQRIMSRRLQPNNECSSFAAFGEKTQTGEMIVGRNTDYHGAGLWDMTQVVFFYQPLTGYRYVNIGCAGLIKCNSCLNEQGLFLGGHFIFSIDVNPAGAGFTALQHAIMQRAANIDEAFQVVKASKRAGSFAYLLASGKDGDAAVLEATSGCLGLRHAENGAIFETNYMTTPECQAADMLQELGITRNPLARFKRLEELIDQFAGRINLQHAAHFMGDHKEMACGDLRPFGNVIATLSNLTSVIFKPQDFTFWVADGPAPVCNNAYIGFDFFKELEKSAYSLEPPVLEPNEYVKTAGFEALRQYYPIRVRAVLPPFQRADLAERVKDMVNLIPGEVAYRLLLGKLLLKATAAQEACTQFKLLVDYSLSPSEQAQVLLYLGMTYDLIGAHADAQHCYRDIVQRTQPPLGSTLQSTNPFIIADAEKLCKTGFTHKDLHMIEINLDMWCSYDW
jgi:hypothetical protein